MLNDLKRTVCKANRALASQAHVKFNWGSVSAFDPSMGLYVIKPSNVPFEDLQPELMVVMSMDGQKVEGRLEPSYGHEIHRALYWEWPLRVGAIAHSRSLYASSFAQAGMPIPVLGSTHTRFFSGDIPVTPHLSNDDIHAPEHHYRLGQQITATISEPENSKAALINGYYPITWGSDCMSAVNNIVVLEALAQMAVFTRLLNPDIFNPRRIEKTDNDANR